MNKILGVIFTLALLLTAVPSTYAAQEAYTIDRIFFTDLKSTPLEEPVNGCFANVQVTKNEERSDDDLITLAAYTKENSFIGLYFTKGTMGMGETRTYAVTIRVPEGKKLGKVKAFVTSDIATLTPLSKAVVVEVTPTVPEIPPEEGAYLMDTFTFSGYISKTAKTDWNMGKSEIELSIGKVLIDYSACKTMEQYFDLKQRVEESLSYYGIRIEGGIGRITAECELTDMEIYTCGSFTVKADDAGGYMVTGIETISENSRTIDAKMMAGYEVHSSNPYIAYYPSLSAPNPEKIYLDPQFKLIVNGIELYADVNNLSEYVFNNSFRNIRFVDMAWFGQKADGKYDVIYAEYYGTAKVSGVNLSTGRIAFEDHHQLAGSITLSPEDNDLVYDIYYKDEKVDLSAIQPGDILSVAYDVEENSPTNSTFFEIYISRDVIEGQCNKIDKDEEKVFINMVGYEMLNFAFSDEYTLGHIYKVYLDAFGRIFSFEKKADLVKYAIVEKYTKSVQDDYYRAQLYMEDGTVGEYEVDTTKVTFNGKTGHAVNDEILSFVYINYGGNEKRPIERRVVRYKISSTTNRIIEIESVYSEREEMGGSFRESSMTIGSIKMSASTKIVDAIEYVSKQMTGKNPTYNDLTMSSTSGFVNMLRYTAYAFGVRNTDGTYPYVLVTEGSGVYSAATPIAVLSKVWGEADGEELTYKIEALCDGTLKSLVLREDVEVNGANHIMSLQKGDVIIFATDGKELVKRIDVLMSAAQSGISDGYNRTLQLGLQPTASMSTISIPYDAANWTKYWTKEEAYNNDYSIVHDMDITHLVYGPIVDKNNWYFTLGSIAQDDGTYYDNFGRPVTYTGVYTGLEKENGKGGVIDISISANTKVYVYDYTKSNPRSRLYQGGISDIIKTSFANSDLYVKESYGQVIPWNIVRECVPINFAFAKMVEDEATDVFVIIGSI